MRKITFLLLICALCPVFAFHGKAQATIEKMKGSYSGSIAFTLKDIPLPGESLNFQVTEVDGAYQLVIPQFPIRSLIVAILGNEDMADIVMGAIGSTLEYSMPMDQTTGDNAIVLRPEALELPAVGVSVLIAGPVPVSYDSDNDKMSFTLEVPGVNLGGNPLDVDVFPIVIAIEGTKEGSGVNTIQKDAALAIYPNAGNNELRVVSASLIRDYQIISLNGAVVAAAQVNAGEKQISISELPVGVYLLKVNTENGTIVKKFVRR